MKRLTLVSLVAIAMLSVSCYPTRIVTVSPGPAVVHSTTISYPNHNVTQVYASDYDICLHLDLQAVGAAFAQAYTVKEFEMLLNNSAYPISNLDLNRDGYIDYLRVLETVDRHTHIFLIQAVLGRNVFQDVATLVVENPSLAGTYVEIIGAPYLYGQKYIVRPVYRTRPNIYAHLCVRNYTPWMSPWYWESYPSYYKRPVPVLLSHYQAYVTTYMHNHRFCHEVMYPSAYHYTNYDRVTMSLQRHDYSTAHPEQSFTVRNADVAGSDSAVRRAQNARDIRMAQEAATRTPSTAGTSASRTPSTSAGTPSRTPSTSAASGSRTQGTATTPSRTGSTSASAGTRTQSSAAGSSSSATRTGSTSTGTNNAATRTGSTSTGRSGSSSQAATRSDSGQTTVSRVNASGSSRTRTTTTATESAATRSSSATSSSTSSAGSDRRGSTSGSTATRSSNNNTSTSTSGGGRRR